MFLVRYPNTTLKDSCNTLIDRMRSKLELKSFEGSLQYYRMQQYQASGVAFRNFNKQWPNSVYRERSMLYILRSDHHLAVNSVETKRLERLNEAIGSYLNFADAFPNSQRLAEAEKLHQELITARTRHTEAKNP